MATDAEPTPSHNSESAREVLRAKYVEYCSAQLADLLLYLTPDEIYLLAQRAAPPGEEDRAPGHASYGAMVERATGWLASRVALPPFEVWIEDYRRHPERYESYLMGLWEADAPPATSAARG